MRKILILFGIILTLCFSSYRSSAITVSAYCNGTYIINDADYQTGDTYTAGFEIDTQYPTSSQSSPFTPFINLQSSFGVVINNIGLGPIPPVNEDYYNMILVVFKYRGGSLYERKEGSMYGTMTLIGSNYILTANEKIVVTM